MAAGRSGKGGGVRSAVLKRSVRESKRNRNGPLFPPCLPVIITDMKVRGRRVTIGVVVVGAIVIVWAGIAFEEKLVEQWYLWKLDSVEEQEQQLAAEKLGQMKSRRAIPRLVEILRRSKLPSAFRSVAFSPDGSRIFFTSRDGTLELWKTGDFRSHYSYQALVRIGRPAAHALLHLLEDTDKGNRLAAAAALKEIDPQEHQEVSVLQETLEINWVTPPWPEPNRVAGN